MTAPLSPDPDIQRRLQRDNARRYKRDRCRDLERLGVCIRCASRDAAPERVHCLECLAQQRDWYRRQGSARRAVRDDRRRGNGLCAKCGRAPVERRPEGAYRGRRAPGTRYAKCAACRGKDAARHRARVSAAAAETATETATETDS